MVHTTDQSAEFPGPQTRIRRKKGFRILILGLATVFILFAAHSVAVALWPAPRGADWLWSAPPLPLGNALALILAVLGFAFARNQFEASLAPRLVYEGRPLARSEYGLKSGTQNRYWTSTLRNVGRGYARFRDVTYRLEFAQAAAASTWIGFERLIQILREAGLENNRDIRIIEITRHACLAGGGNLDLLQLPLGGPVSITTLDIRLVFLSVLGDEYSKTVFCVPRGGLPGDDYRRILLP